MISTYEIRELTENQFTNFESEWQNCLQDSSSDKLFLSWAWCYSWWKTWSEKYKLKLYILLFYKADKLIAIAPFFYHFPYRSMGPDGPQLQFLGNAWRIGPTVRSEYTSLLVSVGHEQEVCSALREHLQKQDFQDLIIQDHTPEMLEQQLDFGGSITTRSVDKGVHLNVTGKFDSWVSSLGKNTRLKVFNRRNYLRDRVELIETPVDDEHKVKQFFDILSRFNMERRQEKTAEKEIDFHLLLSKYSGRHLKPKYSILTVDGEPVSIVYDVCAGEVRHNLQCVFTENFDKKVSLGLLHLGYMIEKAFSDADIKIYDLLAGKGKNSFYKERLVGDAGKIYDMVTSQVSLTFRHRIYLSIQLLVRKLRRTLAEN